MTSTPGSARQTQNGITGTRTKAETKRQTGCPSGCSLDFHDVDCGAEAFIASRKAHRAASERRDREHDRKDAHLRAWLRVLLRGAA